LKIKSYAQPIKKIAEPELI